MYRGAVRARRGFTYVEMLVTVSIMVFVAAAISVVIHSGIKIWQREIDIGLDEDAWVFFEKLRSDLRSGAHFSGMPFSGDATEISFPAITEQITCVRYAYDRCKKVMYKEERDFGQYRAGRQVVQETLLSGVSSCKMTYLFYLGKTGLKDKAVLAKGEVPRFVKIELTAVTADGGKKQFSEMIELPVAR